MQQCFRFIFNLCLDLSSKNNYIPFVDKASLNGSINNAVLQRCLPSQHIFFKNNKNGVSENAVLKNCFPVARLLFANIRIFLSFRLRAEESRNEIYQKLQRN